MELDDENKLKIWDCKIGEVRSGELPIAADYPMRLAVEKAYKEITGKDPDFIVSGWGGELTEGEREVHNKHDQWKEKAEYFEQRCSNKSE